MHNADLITPQHLARKAVIYIRQSTPHQVLSHQESLRLQYALGARAHQLGWPDEAIDIIDDDLGLTAQLLTIAQASIRWLRKSLWNRSGSFCPMTSPACHATVRTGIRSWTCVATRAA